MFRRKLNASQRSSLDRGPKFSASLIEALEDRRLLSASGLHHHVHAHVAKHHKHASVSATVSTPTTTSSTSSDPTAFSGHGRVIDTIEFQDAPTLVQNGLNSLAMTDGLAAPTATQTVRLGNANGVETYSIEYTTTGTFSRLTVDENGIAVTAPTQTTWAAIAGTAAATEISAIVTALNLTAPTDGTVVYVGMPNTGPVTYTVHLTSADTSTSNTLFAFGGATISVNANGIPVGNQKLPFSALPTTIQGYINGNLPAGVTALDPTSTQDVFVRTIDGVTTFSTTFNTTGTSTTITVDTSDNLVTLPTAPTTTTFADIPMPAQTELQTLATADGVTTTISDTQSVNVYSELNGTTIYSVTLPATDSTTSQTFNITVASDALGNPTVPPNRGFGGFGGGGDCGPGQMGGDFSASAAAGSGIFEFAGQEGPPGSG